MKQDIQEGILIPGSVVVVLQDQRTGKKRTIVTKNLILDAGDLYYSQRAGLLTIGPPVSPLPTNFTDSNGVPDMIAEMYDNTPANNAPAKGNDRSDLLGTIIPGSAQGIDATYPQVNDPDSDNTGAGVDILTYRISYGTADAINPDTPITDLILTNPSPGASEPALNHAEFPTPFDKTINDTMKVFINHQFNGVP